MATTKKAPATKKAATKSPVESVIEQLTGLPNGVLKSNGIITPLNADEIEAVTNLVHGLRNGFKATPVEHFGQDTCQTKIAQPSKGTFNELQERFRDVLLRMKQQVDNTTVAIAIIDGGTLPKIDTINESNKPDVIVDNLHSLISFLSHLTDVSYENAEKLSQLTR